MPAKQAHFSLKSAAHADQVSESRRLGPSLCSASKRPLEQSPIPATSAYSQFFQTGKAAKDSLRQLRQSIVIQHPKKGRQRQKVACQQQKSAQARRVLCVRSTDKISSTISGVDRNASVPAKPTLLSPQCRACRLSKITAAFH